MPIFAFKLCAQAGNFEYKEPEKLENHHFSKFDWNIKMIFLLKPKPQRELNGRGRKDLHNVRQALILPGTVDYFLFKQAHL